MPRTGMPIPQAKMSICTSPGGLRLARMRSPEPQGTRFLSASRPCAPDLLLALNHPGFARGSFLRRREIVRALILICHFENPVHFIMANRDTFRTLKFGRACGAEFWYNGKPWCFVT